MYIVNMEENYKKKILILWIKLESEYYIKILAQAAPFETIKLLGIRFSKTAVLSIFY